VDLIARVMPAGIEICGYDLINAGGGLALYFELAGELLGEVVVEQLLATLDPNAKQTASNDRDYHAFGDGLKKLIPLF
jgi:hypothetical protein